MPEPRSIILELPWPPSVNGYWRAVNGRNILSKKGREYRERVGLIFAEYRATTPGFEPLEGRLEVHIDATPPDKRRRDLDNINKGLLDALERSRVYLDDEQIDDLHIVRWPSEKPGKVVVKIWELEDAA